MRAPVDKSSAFLTGWKAKVRSAAFEAPERFGIRLERLEDTASFVDDASTTSPGLMNAAASIPGMISHRRGMYYYWLAYAGVPGDIIELGCWQGRSTTFLAQACKDSGNGIVHVVDTFKGNPGNEAAYQVSDDMAVHWHIDDQLLPYHVPGMLLQPLVENAIHHGFSVICPITALARAS